MQQKTKDIQNHFEGFLKTPSLWFGNTVYGLKQFEIDQESISFNKTIDATLRLGKYIERFVSYQLSQQQNIEIVSENIQIQKEKITVGEIDFLLLKDQKAIHLEVVYKFYLYDASVGKDEIAHFIGPNRKDSLVSKLEKLKEKQLPLLYSSACKDYLKTFSLTAETMDQQVYFRAQLFLPYSKKNCLLNHLNSACIFGFYIKREEINHFEECKFHIPNKKDWLVVPHPNVSWQILTSFLENSSASLEREFSPMCWLKKPNGMLEKFFLVWW